MRLIRILRVTPLNAWHRLGHGLILVLGTWTVEAAAQAPTPDLPAGSTPVKTTKTVDLTNRYRFTERYPREDGRNLPGVIGPYRIGLVEVIKDVIDQPQGAPRRSETTRQSVFIERGAEQGGMGGLIGSVRTYEKFATRPDDPARTMGPAPLDGLAVALRFRATDYPFVVPLADRKPTDYEFEVISRQMVVPQLGLLLPGTAVRIGDTWRIPRRGSQVLLGEPGTKGDSLVGKFNELRKEIDGPRLVAEIGVSGRVPTPMGDAAVNAVVLFTFDPEAVKAANDSPSATRSTTRAVEGLIDARGAITEVRMARTTTGPLPGPGRLKFQTTREVTMQRQLDPGPAGLALPKLPPATKLEDPKNWLVWLDPSKRFQLDHPQDFLPPERPSLAPGEPGSAVLGRTGREGTDLIQLEFVPRVLTPEDLKAKLAAKYSLMKLKVIEGDATWLPEVEWQPNRKVHRIEAAVEVPDQGGGPSGRATRIHFDGYLIQTSQAASLLVIATTTREPAASVRREVEQILKTIQVDPPRPDAPR